MSYIISFQVRELREKRRKKMEARNEEAAALLGLGARQKTMVEDKKKVSQILVQLNNSFCFFLMFIYLKRIWLSVYWFEMVFADYVFFIYELL